METIDFLLTSRQDMFIHLKRKIEHTQEKMKSSVDSHRLDISFSVDDWVYVKLRPYRQTSLAGNNYQKLGKCYYGPYQVIERVGLVAYKLALPASAKIHPMFHCLLLKPHSGPMASD